jgi:hypothetical protein
VTAANGPIESKTDVDYFVFAGKPTPVTLSGRN